MNENLRGQAFNIYIEDAIQETTVATDGVSAEFGRFSGGVVNVITKSGGNLFSGSFRDSLNNDNWRALVTATATTHARGRIDHTGVQHRDVAERRTGADPSCFANDVKGRQDRCRTHEYMFGGPVAKGSSVVLHRRPVPEPAGLSRSTIAPLNIPYIVGGSRRKRFEIKLTGVDQRRTTASRARTRRRR